MIVRWRSTRRPARPRSSSTPRQAAVHPPGRLPERRPSSPPTSAATRLAPDVDVRLARDADELRAALALRHAVFVDEQGVPLADELDGRDDEALQHRRRARRRGRRHLPPARRGRRTRSSAGWPSTRAAARRAGSARAARRGRAVGARRGRRGDRARRPDLRGVGSTRRDGYRAVGPTVFLDAGHRARDGWRRPLPEVRVDPLTGLRAIVAAERADAARRRPERRAGGADRPRDRPVPRGPRGPHAARGLRGAPGRRRAGHARAGRCASCPTSTRRWPRDAPRRPSADANPDLFTRARRRAAPTR